MVIAVVSEKDLFVSEARASDVPQIVSLINRAFNVERFFKDADRTNAETSAATDERRQVPAADGCRRHGCCIFVKQTGDRAYLGTLAVDPGRQKSGIGARMMQEAEAYAREQGCSTIDIRIVNLRTELPPIYRKFGFVETGTEVLSDTTKFTQPVHFLKMSKEL